VPSGPWYISICPVSIVFKRYPDFITLVLPATTNNAKPNVLCTK